MLNKMLDALKDDIAYRAYVLIYGIDERPFEKAKVLLSGFNNAWNIAAFESRVSQAPSAAAVNREDDEVKVNVTDANNRWNKIATEL